ncbi:MAG TPA: hypothetical protein VNK70_02975 [Candidatus Paceibacterota bacterium]|nr:hypothetical protein [Candidatus Paceibacterota bacterium]
MNKEKSAIIATNAKSFRLAGENSSERQYSHSRVRAREVWLDGMNAFQRVSVG